MSGSLLVFKKITMTTKLIKLLINKPKQISN